MTDSNVFQLSQPGTFSDPLTQVRHAGLRGAARPGRQRFADRRHPAFLAAMARVLGVSKGGLRPASPASLEPERCGSPSFLIE